MMTQDLQDILDRWVEEDEKQAQELDWKLQEIKHTLNQMKDIQARMMELV